MTGYATTLAKSEAILAAGQATRSLAKEWGLPGKGDDPASWPVSLP